MNSTTPPDLPANQRVRPVHTRVKGRARFEVLGLYRAPWVKERLEQGLAAMAGVQRVHASVLTGRVLVVYTPGTPLRDVLKGVQIALGDHRGPQSVRSRVRSGERGRASLRFSVSHALSGFSAVLRGDPRPFSRPLPVAAAADGAPILSGGAGGKLVQEIQPWHVFDLNQVLSALGTSDEDGLSAGEAGERLRRYGENALAASKKRSDLSIFVEQFLSAPVYMLGVSAVVAVLTGGTLDAAVILGVVLILSLIHI